jgi:bud site selection protein 20
MGRLRRSRTHKAIKHIKKQFRTRRRTKDLDIIHAEINDPEKLAALQAQPIDPDMPGLGQFYCVECRYLYLSQQVTDYTHTCCSRYLISQNSLDDHLKSKLHKKRVKLLKEEPYTQESAEAAVGLTTQNSRSAAIASEDAMLN